MTQFSDLLAQGIAAAKAGRKQEAREALTQATELDQFNEQAWMWLSGVVETLEERQICLENVLTINANNAAARKGLEWLRKQQPAPPVVSSPAASVFTDRPTNQGMGDLSASQPVEDLLGAERAGDRPDWMSELLKAPSPPAEPSAPASAQLPWQGPMPWDQDLSAPLSTGSGQDAWDWSGAGAAAQESPVWDAGLDLDSRTAPLWEQVETSPPQAKAGDRPAGRDRGSVEWVSANASTAPEAASPQFRTSTQAPAFPWEEPAPAPASRDASPLDSRDPFASAWNNEAESSQPFSLSWPDSEVASRGTPWDSDDKPVATGQGWDDDAPAMRYERGGLFLGSDEEEVETVDAGFSTRGAIEARLDLDEEAEAEKQPKQRAQRTQKAKSERPRRSVALLVSSLLSALVLDQARGFDPERPIAGPARTLLLLLVGTLLMAGVAALIPSVRGWASGGAFETTSLPGRLLGALPRYGLVAVVPFFAATLLTFAAARLLRGKGNLWQHSHMLAIAQTAQVLLVAFLMLLLAALPKLTGDFMLEASVLVASLSMMYAAALLVLAVKAAHGLESGKAVGVLALTLFLVLLAAAGIGALLWWRFPAVWSSLLGQMPSGVLDWLDQLPLPVDLTP